MILETPETNSEITEQVEPSETETIICQASFLGRTNLYMEHRVEYIRYIKFQKYQLSIPALVLSQYFMPSKRLCIHHAKLHALAMPRTALRPRQ